MHKLYDKILMEKVQLFVNKLIFALSTYQESRCEPHSEHDLIAFFTKKTEHITYLFVAIVEQESIDNILTLT